MKTPKIIADSPVKIVRLVPGGQGIGTRADGKKGFFWNVLPGEEITEYRITKEKSSYFEAIALKITQPSAHRVAPKDACFLSTSPWQIMDYDYELAQKAEILSEIFRQAGLTEALKQIANQNSGETLKQIANQNSVSTTEKTSHKNSAENAIAVKTAGSDYFYRNKMEYALYWDNDAAEIKLAFHERGSHRKIPISSSSIEKPEIFAKAQRIVAELNAQHEEARKYQSLLLRSNQTGKVSGGLYENGKPHPIFDNLTDQILGQTYSYSPNGFFQINLPVYELALQEIKQHINTDKVLDLYSGVGTIGLSVAGDKNLTLVESNPDAYRELEINWNKSTPINRGQGPVLLKSEDALNLISPNATIIVDPPRAGCDKKLLDKFLEVKPPKIIYLSCNPVTQARDLKILEPAYKIVKIQPFNFFPHTPHLENLAVLELR